MMSQNEMPNKFALAIILFHLQLCKKETEDTLLTKHEKSVYV